MKNKIKILKLEMKYFKVYYCNIHSKEQKEKKIDIFLGELS